MRVVIWSGGLDSTVLLADELSRVGPSGVRALTLVLEGATDIPQGQKAGEKRARAEFKKWAKKKHGWKFQHDVVRVKTAAHLNYDVGQHGLWIAHLSPYIGPNDTMLFGYIRGDDFWHYRHLVVEAFGALKRSHYAGRALIQTPYEWHRKVDLLAGAKNFKIPQRCWWTCSTNKVRKTQCGRCLKCRTVKRAKADLKEFGDELVTQHIRPTKRLLRGTAKELHGSMDVEAELIAGMAEKVSQEIDEEVLDHLAETVKDAEAAKKKRGRARV